MSSYIPPPVFSETTNTKDTLDKSGSDPRSSQIESDATDSHAQPAEKVESGKRDEERRRASFDNLANVNERHTKEPQDQPSYLNWIASQEYQADHQAEEPLEPILDERRSSEEVKEEAPSYLNWVASQEYQADHQSDSSPELPNPVETEEHRPSYFNWIASQEYQAEHQDSNQEFPPLFGPSEEDQKPSFLDWIASQEYQADNPPSNLVYEYPHLFPEQAHKLATSTKETIKGLQEEVKESAAYHGRNLYQRFKDSLLSALHITPSSRAPETPKGSDMWLGDLTGDWRDIDNFRRKAQLHEGSKYFPGYSGSEIVDIMTGYNDSTYFGN